MQIEHPVYFGNKLHNKGFKVWFLYMFYIVNKSYFKIELIHNELFDIFQDIYDMKSNRNIINIPPRSGKTTLATYFIAYALAKNPKCNFIYTSYSQNLLGQISGQLCNILKHTVYQAMYSGNNSSNISYEKLQEEASEDYWAKFLKDTEKKEVYSTHKIITKSGGTVLFASIGSAITGFGCGVYSVHNHFTGALIIDDANKVGDVRSELLRNKVYEYFNNTLLTRLNHGNVAVLNIQQRLHPYDLTGFLSSKYQYQILKKPLIIDGVCQLQNQYSENRLAEIMQNNILFQTQYQQNPIIAGGTVFQIQNLQFYSEEEYAQQYFHKIFITMDTANKIKEHNDYSVMCLWGINKENHLFLIDMIREKMAFDTLLTVSQNFINKWKNQMLGKRGILTEILIEDKVSGSSLIDMLRKIITIPIRALHPKGQKEERAYEVAPFVTRGEVFLPNYKKNITTPFISECEEFSMDKSHKHDDIVDNLVYALYEAKMRKQSNGIKFIEEKFAY